MSGRTPGNWYTDAHPDGWRVLTDDARSTIICQHIGPISNEGAASDARLIAAAPALLEALQECADRLAIHMIHSEDLVAHMKACNAIAAATGADQ